MKNLIFCLQNHLIEKVLKENGVIDSNSFVIQDKEDLKLDFIKEIDPDFIFFPHWSYKVDNEIIKNFKCICFHSTPLPYGRGGSPIQNMIIRGHDTTEVCSLLMEKEFDAGPVFLRTKISLEGNLHEILIRIYQAIASQIKVFKEKKLKPVNQEGEIVNFKRLKHADNEIDFNLPLEKIFDQIRMLDSNLYPSPYSEVGGCIIEFSDAEFEEGQLTTRVNIKKRNSNK